MFEASSLARLSKNAVFAAFLAGSVAVTADVADAQRRRPPSPAPPAVVVDVDALGLIEAWWHHEARPQRRSSARFARPAMTLLFHCRPTDALYVWVDAHSGPAATPDAAAPTSFGCAVGEGLFAVDGSIACVRHGFAPRVFTPPSAVIAITDGVATHTLTGECLDPAGGVAAAFIGTDVARVAPGPLPGAEPCPGGGSSVRFRGQLTAGGC